jgi:UDP-glucose 4-epimerase
MNALVTGGAGFIGSHLCKRLVNDGHSVVAIDNLSNGVLCNLEELKGNPNFAFYEFDVNDKATLKDVFEKHSFDMVFHLAANADVAKGEENPQEDITNTLQTTLTVLDTMRVYGVKKFFLASSSTVYGNVEGRIQENTTIMRPVSHYGAAKLASEAFVSSFCNLHGFQVWIARFCNAVGPNMTHGVIPDLIRKLKQHPDQLEVYGDGTQSKPYIYIDDMIEGVMCLLKQTSKAYNACLIGVDTNVSVEQIAEIVMDEIGVHVPINYEVGYTGWKGDVTRYTYDVTNLRMLGWTPKYSSEVAVRLAVRQNNVEK